VRGKWTATSRGELYREGVGVVVKVQGCGWFGYPLGGGALGPFASEREAIEGLDQRGNKSQSK
jgi:hypothetical protein